MRSEMEKEKCRKKIEKKIVKSGIWTRDLKIHSEFTMLAPARVQFPSGRPFFLFSVWCFFSLLFDLTRYNCTWLQHTDRGTPLQTQNKTPIFCAELQERNLLKKWKMSSIFFLNSSCSKKNFIFGIFVKFCTYQIFSDFFFASHRMLHRPKPASSEMRWNSPIPEDIFFWSKISKTRENFDLVCFLQNNHRRPNFEIKGSSWWVHWGTSLASPGLSL